APPRRRRKPRSVRRSDLQCAVQTSSAQPLVGVDDDVEVVRLLDARVELAGVDQHGPERLTLRQLELLDLPLDVIDDLSADHGPAFQLDDVERLQRANEKVDLTRLAPERLALRIRPCVEDRAIAESKAFEERFLAVEHERLELQPHDGVPRLEPLEGRVLV